MIECDVCHRVFKNERAVEMHKARVHSGDPRWANSPGRLGTGVPGNAPLTVAQTATPCVICGKQITNARMRSHLRRVHQATGGIGVSGRPLPARPILPTLPDITEVEATGRVVDRRQAADEITIGFGEEPFEPTPDETGELALNLDKLRVIGEVDGMLIVKFGDEYAELTIRWISK